MKNLNLFATFCNLDRIGMDWSPFKNGNISLPKIRQLSQRKSNKAPSLQHREDVLQVLQFRHQLLFDCAFQALNSLAGWTYEKAVVTERPLWPPVTELPSTNWLGVSRPSQMPFGIFPLSVLGNWIQLLVSRCFKMFQVSSIPSIATCSVFWNSCSNLPSSAMAFTCHRTSWLDSVWCREEHNI